MSKILVTGGSGLLGTYLKMEREDLVYGVDVFPNEEENSNVMDLLKQPFQKYRKPTIGKIEK